MSVRGKTAKKSPVHPDPVVRELLRVFGPAAVTTLAEGGLSAVHEVFSTGIPVLDHEIFGVGGLPVGKVIEVAGPEGSGKTTLMLCFVAAAQRQGVRVLFIDAESSVRGPRARALGVDPERVALLEPLCIEEVGDYVKVVTKHARPKGPPTLLIWDSLAETPLAAELEGASRGSLPGERGKKLSEMIRAVKRALARSRTTFVVVNQLRDNINVRFGDKKTTPGGGALKYGSWATLRVNPLGPWKTGSDVVGLQMRVVARKCKGAAPYHPVKLRLSYTEGFDTVWPTLELAIERKILTLGGKKGYVKTPSGKLLSLKKDADQLVRIATKYLWAAPELG